MNSKIRPGDAERCWVCGVSCPAAQSDPFHAPYRLCSECRPLQPAGAHRSARAGSALVAVLGLTEFQWRQGRHQSWSRQVADRVGITAWVDTSEATTPRPEARFDWIPAASLERARELLERLAEDHRRASVPPSLPAIRTR